MMFAKALVAACLLSGFALHASAATDEESVDASAGFLAHYSALEKAGRPRKSYLVYLPEAVEGRQVKAVHVKNAVVAPADAKFDDVSPELLAKVLEQVNNKLRAGLSQKARLTQDAIQADVQLLTAVTAIGAQEKGKGLVDLVPVRLVTGSIRNAVQGKEMEAVITFESRVLEATTGAVLRERIDHVVGGEIGRSGDPDLHITQEALNDAIDDWVKTIVKVTAPKLK
ncbi:MAG: DUF3313 family protein [Pseudomonadales bacterium]|jgi:hypothetical protein